MVIYVDADSTVKADYYDNEGHVIRYLVHSPTDSQAVFLSLASPSTSRYRLTYTLGSDGTLSGSFEIAPSSKPEAFATYLSWAARKTSQARTGSH